MENDFLDFLGGLFEDAAWFAGCGWVVLVVGVVWLCVYVGGQLTLADVQACQAHAQCSVSTLPGFLHVPRRELVATAPQFVPSAPALPASATQAQPAPHGQRLVAAPHQGFSS